MATTMTGEELIEGLRKQRPDVVITASRTPDYSYQWDGDGPDPVEDGYIAYDVVVKSVAIRDGRFVEGVSSLGGSYFRPAEPLGEVNGYLLQMVQEAFNDLRRQLLEALK